ncbi:hypothetical protein [Legionella sp. 16cNR16C]|uniref:hypothetical protein n=1 Tax=Legionella sp. 16cNR16C TaxID=2905656 RepID=UPI001E30AA1D|nr:hypothetical protein [Legionella sp. 16cNR16C]MCE3044465.1 hypothetical protein [Legionella sp. 16cNR16C]
MTTSNKTQFTINPGNDSRPLQNALLQMKLITCKQIKSDPQRDKLYFETSDTQLYVVSKDSDSFLYYRGILLAVTSGNEATEICMSALQKLFTSQINSKLKSTTSYLAQSMNGFLSEASRLSSGSNITANRIGLTDKELEELSPYLSKILKVTEAQQKNFFKLIRDQRIQTHQGSEQSSFSNPFLEKACDLFSKGISVEEFLSLDEQEQTGFACQAKQVLALKNNGVEFKEIMKIGAKGLLELRERLGSEIYRAGTESIQNKWIQGVTPNSDNHSSPSPF